MQAQEKEVFEELRSERLWRLAERWALRVVVFAVAGFAFGLVCGLTVIVMDKEVGPFAPIASDE